MDLFIEVTRRQSLKYVVGLVSSLATTNLFSKEKDKPKSDSKTTVLREFDTKSLEKLLEKGEEELSERKSEVSRKPSIVYLLRSKNGLHEGKLALFNHFRGGSAHVLNPEGFFLTNYHVISDHLSKKRDYPIDIIFADPESKLSTGGVILAYNKKLDLALGKIEIPEKFRKFYDLIPITKREPKPGEKLTSIVFGNPNHLRGEVFDRTLKSLEIKSDKDKKLRFGYGRDLPKIKIEYNTPMGKVKPAHLFIVNVNRNGGFGVPEGEYIIICEENKKNPGKGRIFKGNSGSPVYKANGEIAGIIKSAKETRIGGGIMTCTTIGPTSIRSFLKDYIKHQR